MATPWAPLLPGRQVGVGGAGETQGGTYGEQAGPRNQVPLWNCLECPRGRGQKGVGCLWDELTEVNTNKTKRHLKQTHSELLRLKM